MKRAQGAALLMVLWIILMLAGLVSGYALSARVESMQGNGLARELAAREAARAGVEYAVKRMLEPNANRRFAADGRVNRLVFEGTPVDVEVRDETAKIDLNAAAPELLQAFFQALGEPRESAVKLSLAIVDWRDPDSLTQPGGGAEDADYAAAGLAWGAKDAPFASVSELEQVLGMRPALFKAAAPFLTVYTGSAMPDPQFADGIVLQAMGMNGKIPAADPDAPPRPGSGTYSIDSRARRTDGRIARISVVLRMGGNGLPGSTYTPLRWQADGGWQ